MGTFAAEGVGILGGTFDPVHYGHLRLAWETLQHLRLDHVRLIPCHVTTHRAQPVTASADRLAMTRLACQNAPGLQVDPRELQRDAPSWTYDTLTDLRGQLGPDVPLVFIMGMDAFRQFSRWHRYRDILALAHLWVARRPGSEAPAAHSAEDALLQACASTDPLELRRQPAGRIMIRETVALDISATFIRQQYAQGLSPRFLLPDEVNDYIVEKALYPSTPSHGDN
jgi:nicotinate-nucleotide adenylyltransferase